jgi:O-antigen/teichoic acid export membrane protein
LKGLAQAQLAQSVLLFGLCWFFLRRQLPNLPWIPSRWSRVEFKEMFSYAVHFQIASIVGLFFDPITKFLLSKYGGLSDTAYYEMASQIITKVRAVLISALQVLVPVISGIKNTDYQQLNNIYQKSYRMLFFIVWPYYLCVALAFPLISLVWIGHSESRFIISGQILAVGWLLSSLGLPAYFHNLGTGKIVWNTATQTLTAFLNSLLGWLLGATYGSIGVVIAAMLSLTLPIWLLIFIVQRNLKVDNKELFPKESRRVMMIAIIGAIWGFVFMAYGKIYFSDEVSSSIVLLSYTCFMFLTIHSHPFWKKIQTFLLRR